MANALAAFDVLPVFKGTVVITIKAEAERLEIQNVLQAAAQTIGNRAWALISPPMNGGAIYRGLLAQSLWPELNKRTT